MASGSVFPSGVVAPDTAVVTGAASVAAALSDGTDASYITKTGGSTATRLEMTNFTKPLNSVVKSLRVTVRGSSSDANSARIVFWLQSGSTRYGQGIITRSGTTAGDVVGPWINPPNWNPNTLDALRVYLSVPDSGDSARIHRVFLEYVIAEQPTVSADGPTGTVATSSPTVDWTHTPGADGGPQTAVFYRIYNQAQYTSTGFNPETTGAWYSFKKSTSQSSGLTIGLREGAHRFYVKTAQTVNNTVHWSAWDYSPFTVDFPVTPPIDPEDPGPPANIAEVQPVIDSSTGRVEVSIDRVFSSEPWDYVKLERRSAVNMLPNDAGRFESDTNSDGVSNGFVIDNVGTPGGLTFSRVSSTGRGMVQRIQSTLLQDGEVAALRTDDDHWAPAGASRMVTVSIEASPTIDFPDQCGVRLGIIPKDAAGVDIGSVWTEFPPEFGGWTRYETSYELPSQTRYVAADFGIYNMQIPSTVSITCDFNDFLIDLDGEWKEVRGATDVVPPADQVIIFDREAPPNRPLRYRARGVRSGPVESDWVYSDSFVEWALTSGIWIKSLEDERKNVQLRLAIPPSKLLPQRQGLFRPIGNSKSVVVADVRGDREVPLLVTTYTEEEAFLLELLLEEPVILVHMPDNHRFESGYFACGDLQEVHLVPKVMPEARNWSFDITEVDPPA